MIGLLCRALADWRMNMKPLFGHNCGEVKVVLARLNVFGFQVSGFGSGTENPSTET
jgi:hypothetical protein